MIARMSTLYLSIILTDLIAIIYHPHSQQDKLDLFDCEENTWAPKQTYHDSSFKLKLWRIDGSDRSKSLEAMDAVVQVCFSIAQVYTVAYSRTEWIEHEQDRLIEKWARWRLSYTV